MRAFCILHGLAAAGLLLLASGGAAAQPADNEYSLPPPASDGAPSTNAPAYTDPFADSLFVLRTPAGLGLGLVYTQVETSVVVGAETYDEYAGSIDDAEIQRRAALIALPIGRGMLVTGDVRYVRMVGPMDVGRAPVWSWVAARGGGVGVMGAF